MDIRNYNLSASDGSQFGRVHDVLFDDRRWTVRYFELDTGNWLPGRRVLISPESVERLDGEQMLIELALTREQVEESPSIGRDQPVSRQHEMALAGHYGWPTYWAIGPHPVAGLPVQATPPEAEAPEAMRGDPTLRSMHEVAGYHVEASDKEVGKVTDFVVDTEAWEVLHLVVKIGGLFSSREVLVPPTWRDGIDWREQRVRVDIESHVIEQGPEWDPTQPINKAFETRLYDYYGRPVG